MFAKLKRLFSFGSGTLTIQEILAHPGGRRHYREQHTLRRDHMDPDAIKVVNRLNRNGYRSYLVGGCVRDMLLGLRPKDFDVVTSATPTQIRNLFSNSRAIGRRFKIVHVVFRGKVIEVSTFRSLPEHRFSGKATDGEDLMMRRDNDFGDPPEDAARRDFSINALFFDTRNESIIDYVGGFEDVKDKVIRVIGDPELSFKEDPVRMLRAAKFAGLKGFKMDSACLKAVRKHRGEIAKASPSRMIEEYYKIFRTGHASLVFKAFADSTLLRSLLPESVAVMTWEKGKPFFESSMGARLKLADKLLDEREELTTNIFWALLFADLLADVLAGDVKKNVVEHIKARLMPVCQRLQIAGRDRDRLVQMFAAQHRFRQTGGQRRSNPEFFRKKVFFYEAFMLYKIIAITGQDEEAQQRAMFWEIGLRAHPPEPAKIVTLFDHRRRRRRMEKPAGESGGRKRSSEGGSERGGRRRRTKSEGRPSEGRQDKPAPKKSDESREASATAAGEGTGRKRRRRSRSGGRKPKEGDSQS